MGWETLAMVDFQAVSGASQVSAARKNAKAGVQEAERNALSVAEDTVRRAGTLRVSYLNAGIDLEGGPMDVISRAFAKGRTDISRIETNANTASKNTVSTARTKMIQGLAGSAAGAVGDLDFGGSGISGLGQEMGSLFDSSPTGPYLSPLDSSFYNYNFGSGVA